MLFYFFFLLKRFIMYTLDILSTDSWQRCWYGDDLEEMMDRIANTKKDARIILMSNNTLLLGQGV